MGHSEDYRPLDHGSFGQSSFAEYVFQRDVYPEKSSCALSSAIVDGISFDDDGIARLVVPRAPFCPITLADSFIQQEADLDRKRPNCCLPSSESCVFHSEGGSLHHCVQGALALGTEASIELATDCHELDFPLEVKNACLTLTGSDKHRGRVQLNLRGVRVMNGGTLHLKNLELVASEENRVQDGLLTCTNCIITSRHGCGILCLQKARVRLSNCEISGCLRSGVGVNGKNTEIDIQGCTVCRNNFSGIGVNHQARSVVLRENKICDNGYHGIWLNVGVVANWHGGEMTGNRLSSKDGGGVLRGFDAGTFAEVGSPKTSRRSVRKASPFPDRSGSRPYCSSSPTSQPKVKAVTRPAFETNEISWSGLVRVKYDQV